MPESSGRRAAPFRGARSGLGHAMDRGHARRVIGPAAGAAGSSWSAAGSSGRTPSATGRGCCAASQRRSRHLWSFAGFAGLGGALLARLQELGATVWPPTASAAPAPRWQSVGCADPADELRCAARWCREQLARNPRGALAGGRHPTQAAARAGRAGFRARTARQRAARPPWARCSTASRAASRWPTMRWCAAALDVLQLSGGALEFPQLAALLRSPYIGCGTLVSAGGPGTRAARTQRRRGRFCAPVRTGRCAAVGRGRGAGRHAAGHRPVMGRRYRAEPITGPAGRGISPRASRPAAGQGSRHWGARSSSNANACGTCSASSRPWAGSGTLLSFGQALDLLRALARRTSFEAATPDVPVTLTESIDDPLIDYDGIWVAGLSAESWPAPPRADPFAPIGAQRTAGYPARQRARAARSAHVRR